MKSRPAGVLVDDRAEALRFCTDVDGTCAHLVRIASRARWAVRLRHAVAGVGAAAETGRAGTAVRRGPGHDG